MKMDRNWSLNLSKNLSCLGCNSYFCIKGSVLKGSKCPTLLKCGHSLCNSCVKQNFKSSNVITCLQCQTSFSLESKSMQDFSFNLYLIGTLTMCQFEKQEKDKKLAILTTEDVNFNYSVNPSIDNKSLLCEECSMVAYWSCKNCQCYYCDPCWSKVHGAAKSLMKHVKLLASVLESTRTEYSKCQTHEMQDLDLFCKTCRKAVCSFCVIHSHQGGQHSLITVREQNSEMVNQLKSVAEEAEVVCKRMKQTLEKIKITQSSSETSSNHTYSNIKNEILSKFARLHGILQLQEEKLFKQLYITSNQRDSTLRDLGVQLETQIQKTEFLLEKYEAFVKNPKITDLNMLYDHLSEVKTLPCYLISQKCNYNDPKVFFDDSLIKLLENYCTIDLPSNKIYELRSDIDLPEDFAVEPLPVSVNCDEIRTHNISISNSDVDTTSEYSSYDLNDSGEFSKFKPSKSPHVFLEGRKYSVHITYINNPGEFYVTLNSERKMKENIEKRATSCGYPFIVSSTICKDELYFVKYKVDGKWYRGRIIEVLPNNNASQARVVVHYIDYGNTDTVSVSWMKPLPPDLCKEPPLAIKCKFFNCVARSGKWSKDSVKTMEKIVNGLTATMFVMSIQSDCLEVDLSVINPDGQIGRDIVSVRDALIFLEYASFVGGAKIQDNPPAVKYEEQCIPSAGECFDVLITHVNSPDDFYLHRVKQDITYLCNLERDLQNYYNENSQKGLIYNPRVGMPCAAKFSADKKWYRAIIDSLPGKKLITVFYVDYGNKENVPWTDIRKLRENFVKRPPLAINCSMARIQSKTIDNWNPLANAYLGKCISRKGMWVQVDGTHSPDQKLKVLLYEQLDESKVCVNFLFVEMGFAFNSVDKTVSHSILPSLEETSKQNGEEKQLEKNYIKIDKCEKVRKSKLSAKELRQNYESEKRQFEEFQTAVDNSSETGSETGEIRDCIFKVKVVVLSAESPSSIYITFSRGNEEFRTLQSKLNDFYENTVPLQGKEWSVDSKCAVYYSEGKCWCRASVSKIMADGLVKVFLKDFAITVTVHSSLLRDLNPIFTKYGPRAIKCHLADVEPPCDTWPSISCEYLASELEEYPELYMAKKGQIENNSLPIELWVQKIIPGSALEPTSTEWTTLNKLLVEKGLAVPIRNWDLTFTAEEGDVPSEKEVESVDKKSEGFEESTTELTSFLPSLSCQWSPPELLKKTRFIAIPTYVDHDGYIYVQDVEDQRRLLDIRNSLLEEYGNSKPSAEDHFWSPGQMCIAKYFADNEWYRGVVLETSEVGNYKVLFVDYGNVETCQVSCLRKRVKLTEVPILVHKLKLYGVAPLSRNGKWPNAVIELLHSLLVDEKCEVTVLRPAQETTEPHIVALNILETAQNVATVLVKENLATQLFVDESSDTLENLSCPFQEEESGTVISEVTGSEVNYASLDIPQDCKGFRVLVKAIINQSEFYGHIVDNDHLPLDLKKILRLFQKLEATLEKECHLQPKLTNITEGKPCCCIHSGIKKWCRGLVETVEKDCVCVFYVDYGCKEFLNLDLVHECKLDWMLLPKMAVKFYIPNFAKYPAVSTTSLTKGLTSFLVETEFYAEILGTREDALEVKLLTEKNEVLSYKQIMNTELIENC